MGTRNRVFCLCAILLTTGLFSTPSAHATSYATSVISSAQGGGANPAFGDGSTVLGVPSRETGFGDVTPFNSPFGSDQLFSFGAGGHITVSFDAPIEDDPLNPFGMDLLIFGNSFFFDPSFAPIANDIFAEPANISVSQNGSTWFDVAATADGLFPTSGYLDTADAFADDGTLFADFGLPVDPSIDWQGKLFDEIVALYAGSGGGAGVDISGTGLPWIQYVRVWLPVGATITAEVDAFSDVRALPEPAASILVGLAVFGLAWVRRRP